jgi:hypothetical protein
MNNPTQDAGVLQTLIERLNSQRLPRALALKDKVDRGETLSEFDIRLLEEVFADAHHIQPLVERHPEHQDLVARVLHLYKEILDKALDNEKKA